MLSVQSNVLAENVVLLIPDKVINIKIDSVRKCSVSRLNSVNIGSGRLVDPFEKLFTDFRYVCEYSLSTEHYLTVGNDKIANIISSFFNFGQPHFILDDEYADESGISARILRFHS